LANPLRSFANLLTAVLGNVKIYNLLQKEIRMKIYVGNLSYEVTEDELRLALEQFGQVESATIIKEAPHTNLWVN
jgi:RNA recognition motif-containing protein